MRVSPMRFMWLAIAFSGLAGQVAAGGDPGAASSASVCYQAIDDAARFRSVTAKFPRARSTSAQLAIASVPSDEEAESLRALSRETKVCRDEEIAEVEGRNPLLEPAYRIVYYQRDQVADYLQQGAITYGTANRLNGEARAAFDARVKSHRIAGSDKRAELAELWREQLQRGHSNPPQEPSRVCAWEELNILCE